MRNQFEEAKGSRKATKIIVPRNSNNFFHDGTNLKRGSEETIKPVNGFKPTPTSSKDSGIPIRSRKLLLPIAEKSLTTSFAITSIVNINMNFTTSAGCGIPAIVKPGAFTKPFVFSGSDKLPMSPAKEKSPNSQLPLKEPSVSTPSSHVQHQAAKTLPELCMKRLERHQQMYKSRYAWKNHGNATTGIRMNRRFDLLMKFREDQLDAARSAF